MVKALFDTNILIDYLNGIEQAKDELALYEGRAISIITWMEVMVGAAGDLAAVTRAFLSGFEILAVDEAVAERAVAIRQARRVKLPDAIIRASAEVHGLLLVSRNDKDFPPDDPGVRMPYRI
ncbi:type II toxin-antitoxin system VapC family toxin [Rhizobium sp. S153]|uniref:Ribonuclease VapC n=1 Tax=Ciceribacter sichuanensis TaxID=2949647 RepID=A0ABT0VDZ9_9HYPH|nr:type II toxin-antitoxin system VapC family toxin [Ciceribacter sp. S153]MCM2404099.1 type II toxin-antitoxin system VapC family toxin [Ciceribacter sp. S153]